MVPPPRALFIQATLFVFGGGPGINVAASAAENLGAAARSAEAECGTAAIGAEAECRAKVMEEGDASALLQRRVQAPPREDHQEECGLKAAVFPYVQPQLWGTAYDGWEQCAGMEQSPIDLSSSDKKISGEPISQSFACGGEDIENNGHSMEVQGKFGKLTVGDLDYQSAGIHFHSKSEHTVDGVHFPAEMHIVNKAEKDGSVVLAVVGILFKEGPENECLEQVLDDLPRQGCRHKISPVDLSCFKEQLEGPYWTYDGSLTTPPCTEGVKWTVMARPATLSKSQIAALSKYSPHNFRPPQPRNRREVTYHRVVAPGHEEHCGGEWEVFPYGSEETRLWGKADTEEFCGAGQRQSPIDLDYHARYVSSPKIEQNYGKAGDDIKNNGHAPEVHGNFGSLTIGKVHYESANIHFHHTSEHTVEGEHFPLEMHIVNKAEDGSLAVVGVLFKMGSDNQCLNELLKEGVPRAGCMRKASPVDLSCFDEQLAGPFWRYEGSLTTPPCTEGVTWSVMANMATISPEQLQAITERFVDNARPVQPLNGRDLSMHTMRGLR